MFECETTTLDQSQDLADFIIYYGSHESPFGKCVIAFIEDENEKKICHLTFDKKEPGGIKFLKLRFHGAKIVEDVDSTKELIQNIFPKKPSKDTYKVNLLLKGTDFQTKVWESLAKIPFGKSKTYEQIAKSVNNPKAIRAVGGALKANPIHFLIPCHRAVSKNGCTKNKVGADLKISMQEYEKNLLKNVDKTTDEEKQ
ncbi:uncharacterized protein LOC106649821 [Trichogramma pretiosum]|uniref:uncharacterized protein LOC106649821 n=1 Tax=Trichogramma pretiosum TaxID=7493 RepID=UPI0006C962CB|nr:uncharacterized protein LOC106649821 [Trichogramma pretiosum]